MSPSRPRTALVVDDDAGIRLLLSKTLEFEGWVVRSANDGQQAIDMLLEDPPDLVVLDMMMPRIAGFEVLQAMHDHPILSAIPSIVCSARDSKMERDLAESLGAHRWLVKPIDPGHLIDAAHELVGA